MPFLPPNQQRQSTEGGSIKLKDNLHSSMTLILVDLNRLILLLGRIAMHDVGCSVVLMLMLMSMWTSLRWHFTNKSVAGAPYSIKSYINLGVWSVCWSRAWVLQNGCTDRDAVWDRLVGTQGTCVRWGCIFGVTRRIRLSVPFEAAMRPCVKLLWPLVFIYVSILWLMNV